MALLFFEGFDAYADVTQHNQQANSNAFGAAIDTAVPRTGRACLQVQDGNFWRRLVTPSGATMIFGLSMYWTGSFSAGSVRFFASGVSRSGLMLYIDNLGRLNVGRSSATSNNASNAVAANLWTNTETEPVATHLYYELKVTVTSGTTGNWSLYKNGALLQSQSGVRVLDTSGDVMDTVIVSGQLAGGASNCRIDDIYICDGSGTSNNDVLGPVRVRYQVPTANDTAEFTPSTGTNWQNVDDTTPDDDSSYNSASFTSLPKTDLFTAGTLPPEASLIRGVKTLYRARKEDAATVEMRAVIKSSSSEATGTLRALDTAYTYYADIFETDPATSAAFTPSGVNALKRGYRRVT